MKQREFIAAAALLLFLGGCTNVGYYWQSVRGQLEIWSRQRDITDILQDQEIGRASCRDRV